MKNATKPALLLAAALVLAGCILFAGVMSDLRWDFMKLSTVTYETNTYEIGEAFEHISIHTDTADIVFAVSNDETCKVVCYEEENAAHCVTVENGALTVKPADDRSVTDYIGHIGINFGSPRITVYLPKTQYTSLLIREDTGDITIPKDFQFRNIRIGLSTGDVDLFASASEEITVEGSTGSIRVQNISAGSLTICVTTGKVTAVGVDCRGTVAVNVSTGKANLADIVCQELTSIGNTGDISLQNVIAQEQLRIQRSTGDISFDRCDAAEITVQTSTGDVTGSLLTEKVFITQTSTGKIDVPKTNAGGRCYITTSTGRITITVG